MKKNPFQVAIVSIVITLLIGALLYGAGTFIAMNSDPAQWTPVLRFMTIAVWLYVNVQLVAAAAQYINEE